MVMVMMIFLELAEQFEVVHNNKVTPDEVVIRVDSVKYDEAEHPIYRYNVEVGSFVAWRLPVHYLINLILKIVVLPVLARRRVNALLLNNTVQEPVADLGKQGWVGQCLPSIYTLYGGGGGLVACSARKILTFGVQKGHRHLEGSVTVI